MALAMIYRGELHLSGLNIIGPHLTPANQVDLLKQCHYLSKRKIQEIAVGMMPKPDIKDGIRKLPTIFREATSQRTEALKELAKASDSNININLKFSSAKNNHYGY